MVFDEPRYHFVGCKKDSKPVPEECKLCTLSDPQAFTLYLEEIKNQSGLEAVLFAQTNCLPEYSFALLEGEKLVSYCSVNQRPKPNEIESSFKELVEAQWRTFVEPFEVASARFRCARQAEIVIGAVLQALRQAEFYQIIVPKAYSGLFSESGSVPFASVESVQKLATMRLFQDMGIPEQAHLYHEEVPENVGFLEMLGSRDHLYSLDIDRYDIRDAKIGRTVGPEEVAQLAPNFFESFGDNGKAMAMHLEAAAEGTSTASYDGETNTGACLIKTYGSAIEISSIYTCRAWRKQGLASGLLNHSLSLAKEKGATLALAHVREKNHASTQLFLSFGFVRVESIKRLLEIGRATGFVRERDLNSLLSDQGIKIR